MNIKIRLDQWLSQKWREGQGKIRSRSHGEELIKRGEVFLWSESFQKWEAIFKPSYKISEDYQRDHVQVHSDLLYRVARSGLKLKKALENMGLNPSGLHCLDVGQSTGGFTEVLWRQGARMVVGVEVGNGQLAKILKNQPRIIGFEKLDIRQALNCGDFRTYVPFDLAVIDVSSISLTQVLSSVVQMISSGGHILALVKPSFEVFPKDEGIKICTKSKQNILEVHRRILDHAQGLEGIEIKAYFKSVLLGKEGNQEFFLHLRKNSSLAGRDEEAESKNF